jgi:anti-sigma factor RsiW
MEHDHAIHSMAAERYLLDEMEPAEREDFEEHFFDCAECGAAIRDGAVMIDSGRALVRAERRFQRPKSLTRLTGWIAAGVMAAVAGYQQFVEIPQRVHAAAARPPMQIVSSYAFSAGVMRGSETAPRVFVPAVLSIDIPPGLPFPKYVCELHDASGHVVQSLTASAEQAAQPVLITLGTLPAGRYELVIFGQGADGRRSKVISYPFVVQG